MWLESLLKGIILIQASMTMAFWAIFFGWIALLIMKAIWLEVVKEE